jgi:large subunit ribosomal protein L24
MINKNLEEKYEQIFKNRIVITEIKFIFAVPKFFTRAKKERKMNRKVSKIPKLHIRKNDIVYVLAGNSKGKKGRVLDILVNKGKAFVEGVNIVTKATKPNQQDDKGGLFKKESAINISNLMVVDGKGNPTRIGRREEKGKLTRFSKKTGDIINNSK